MRYSRFFYVIFIILLLSVSILLAGTTGKIAGTITDSETGEPLAGVNVFLEGTTLGAASDVDGAYFIINVPPGKYNLKVSYVGYAEQEIRDVRIQIDLTTRVDVALSSEVMVTEEIVVVAEREVIKKDVAGSQQSVTSENIEMMPYTTIGQVVGLQAGVTSGFSIRGSSAREALFMIDGISFRDERSNNPITEIPLSAVQEISVQSGGVNAEYTNLRSGVVNVVAKEGDPNRYTGTVTMRLSPAHQKHFGISPFDPNAMYLRPYLDPDVAFVGTANGPWDEYTQRQYPQWDGWNKFSESKLADDDPTNDFTPEAAQRIVRWEYRKQGDIKDPDYNIDLGFGGPIPYISKSLGNMRFYFSYMREIEKYMIQLSRDGTINEAFMLKLTSDLTPSIKLSILGQYAEFYATSLSRSGGISYFTSPYDIAGAINQIGFTIPWRLYTNDYWSPASRFSHNIAAKLTHVLNPSTYYEVQLKKTGRKYHTSHGRYRSPALIEEVLPGYFRNEAPFGYSGVTAYSLEGRIAFGGAISTSRDFTRIDTYSLKADFVSQIDFHNQIKTGFEFSYNKLDMLYGSENYFLPEGNYMTKIDESPYRLTLYVQDKIEYEGFVATAGLIMDYNDPNGDWYDIETFSTEFFSASYNPELEEDFKTARSNAQLTWSPRLAISHPITENSKLYFNYGHYRQYQDPQALYRIQRDYQEKLDLIGDPSNPLERTISYELGYDHALFQDFLLHLAAYYKDVSDQQYWVRYINRYDNVNYRKTTNDSYEDIRGFEVELTKMYGRWITGNINYEYRVNTSGYFGTNIVYENAAKQREHDRETVYQEKPRPRPRVKSWIDLHTPPDLGPMFVGQRVLADWHFNFISNWLAGWWGTWNPQGVKGIQYNVQWNDYYNVDLRISKLFPFKYFDIKFIADISNLFNFKIFSQASFFDIHDYNYYMTSLHLPSEIADELDYGNIPGDDGPGDYRKEGVEFQPMEWRADLTQEQNPNTRAIYYDASTEKFMQWNNEEWKEVPQSRIDQINEDKAYIDMPNQTYFTFLNPRSIYLGITLTFRF